MILFVFKNNLSYLLGIQRDYLIQWFATHLIEAMSWIMRTSPGWLAHLLHCVANKICDLFIHHHFNPITHLIKVTACDVILFIITSSPTLTVFFPSTLEHYYKDAFSYKEIDSILTFCGVFSFGVHCFCQLLRNHINSVTWRIRNWETN